jgi:hypothetical protein
MKTPQTPDELETMMRVVEADEAVRGVLAGLIRTWASEDAATNGTFDTQRVMRPVLIGAMKPLLEIAADWGAIGDSVEAIAEGFRRTALHSAELHLKGRAVGWQARLAAPPKESKP